jgi:hypothetical protein
MPRLFQNRKRKPRVSLRIPASAVERVHAQQTRQNSSPGSGRPEYAAPLYHYRPLRRRQTPSREASQTNPAAMVGIPERKKSQ